MINEMEQYEMKEQYFINSFKINANLHEVLGKILKEKLRVKFL